MKKNLLILLVLPLLAGCAEEENRADAYGNFEAEVTTVSALANGQILFWKVTEGMDLEAGELVAIVDTTSLDLQRQQVLATMEAIDQKLRDAAPEIAVLENQKQNLLREIARVERLLEDQAATPKQLDDLQGQLAVLDKKIQAVSSQTSTANRSILAEKGPLRVQLQQIEEQIRNCYVYNPVAGKVLTRLARNSEVVRFGTPLYQIASLDPLTLRAYANALDIQRIATGSEVEVRIDAGTDTYDQLAGRVTWIASEAEFTPKTIQTKEERTNLVYAIEVEVANNGRLKVGMPGEVIFPGSESTTEEE